MGPDTPCGALDHGGAVTCERDHLHDGPHLGFTVKYGVRLRIQWNDIGHVTTPDGRAQPSDPYDGEARR